MPSVGMHGALPICWPLLSCMHHPYLVCILFGMPSLHLFTFSMFFISCTYNNPFMYSFHKTYIILFIQNGVVVNVVKIGCTIYTQSINMIYSLYPTVSNTYMYSGIIPSRLALFPGFSIFSFWLLADPFLHTASNLKLEAGRHGNSNEASQLSTHCT